MPRSLKTDAPLLHSYEWRSVSGKPIRGRIDKPRSKNKSGQSNTKRKKNQFVWFIYKI